MERGRIQGLPKFFEYHLLSQERIKLQTSNLAGILRFITEPFWNMWGPHMFQNGSVINRTFAYFSPLQIPH